MKVYRVFGGCLPAFIVVSVFTKLFGNEKYKRKHALIICNVLDFKGEKMNNIRKANFEDLSRIAEIYVFNYRLNFYPIFKSDWFYFNELQVTKQIEKFKELIDDIFVYDDGAVKGFIEIKDTEIKKLFIEPILQNQKIGAKLLNYAITENKVKFLWALEKNVKAISFYERHGFHKTSDKKLEEGTTENLIRLEM